jgi:cytochrome b
MSDTSLKPTRVWDIPVRICHWAIALAVLGCYGTAEYGWLDMQWHFYFGYSVLCLTCFRVLWGIFGSEHARFADFVRGPGAIIAYLRGRLPERLGHSPIGALSVILLLALLLAQSISGLFNSDEVIWYGPLNERVSAKVAHFMADVHERGETLLLIAIGLHIVAIAYYLVVKKKNLITPMLTGSAQSDLPDARWAPIWRALLLAAIVGASFWALLAFWPKPELLY